MKKILSITITWATLAFLLFSIPAYAEWWEELGEPQYGGTLTIRAARIDAVSFDPANRVGSDYQYCLEELFTNDWQMDRNTWSFKTGFTPVEFHQGLLAESWEKTDPKTVLVHIRPNVFWQDKPPVNGREFTAEDVEYNFDRLMGTGSGFTKQNPFFGGMLSSIEKVTALDKYTVQFKLKKPSAISLFQVVSEAGPKMIAREWVGQSDPGNWQNAIGTGAWMVSDFVSGSSLTFNKNPNYWGRDERHPENRIPYLDTQKLVVIPDMLTAIAAMRTGKIDMIAENRLGPTWIQAKRLSESNPEIMQAWWPNPASTIDLRCDMKPFTDIRVRKALQMAIDIKAVARNIYGGTVDGTPCGLISPIVKDYCFPYDKWPKELKDEYSYNPDKAKKLLAEAGYPDGLSTNCVIQSTDNIELLQAVKSYFMDIGVDMEIKVLEPAVYWSYVPSGKHDQMVMASFAGLVSMPTMSFTARYSKFSRNFIHNNDSNYDMLFNQFNEAATIEEAKGLASELDRYSIEQHWTVCICPTSSPVFWQPWIKGYSGEGGIYNLWAFLRARMWIDNGVKRSMGH